MAQTLAEAKIITREQRRRLPSSSKPYWRGIDQGIHLGYRKGKRGGTWLVRRYLGNQEYRCDPIGAADDELRAGTLDFHAAVKRAKEVVEAQRLQEKASADGSVLTVAQAVEAYMRERDERDARRKGRACRSDATSRLSRYVVGQSARGKRKELPPAPLASLSLHELDESDLASWRAELPATFKHSTTMRLVSDLKAALNAAYMANRSRLPASLAATIKYGLRSGREDPDPYGSIARENQILSDAQVAALISAARCVDEKQGWEGDLFRLVVVLAATGARFSQVKELRVIDVQRTAGRLIIPPSGKGSGTRKKDAVPVPVGKDVLDALLPATSGRAKDSILLERWRSKQVAGGIRWERVRRGPWQAASEMRRPWLDVCAEAGLPDVIPYALRHSSVVRGLRANLPIRLVAALHDTSVAMIERHYGRYIADGLNELAAKSVVPLVLQSA